MTHKETMLCDPCKKVTLISRSNKMCKCVSDHALIHKPCKKINIPASQTLTSDNKTDSSLYISNTRSF